MVRIGKRILVQHEMIGLEVEIVDASDPNAIGLVGEIVDETKETITVAGCEGAQRRMIQKRGTIFGFELDGERVLVIGDRICYRPEDRIKRLDRKWRRAYLNDDGG